MSTTPCVFHRLSVFPPQGAPIPSRRADEKCPRARVYINGSGERRKGLRAVRRLFGGKEGRSVRGVPSGSPAPWGKASRSGGVRRKGWGSVSAVGCRGARRGGGSENGRSGALRLHPSRNGRRGTGAPRPMRLHNSRSISNIVSERCVQIMINVGRSNKFLHNFSTVLYISPVKTSSAHRFFVRCAENLCFTPSFRPAVVKKHPETPQGWG